MWANGIVQRTAGGNHLDDGKGQTREQSIQRWNGGSSPRVHAGIRFDTAAHDSYCIGNMAGEAESPIMRLQQEALPSYDF